ncbi:unnamed protein product, partial [Iphiclides podalirius]
MMMLNASAARKLTNLQLGLRPGGVYGIIGAPVYSGPSTSGAVHVTFTSAQVVVKIVFTARALRRRRAICRLNANELLDGPRDCDPIGWGFLAISARFT